MENSGAGRRLRWIGMPVAVALVLGLTVSPVPSSQPPMAGDPVIAARRSHASVPHRHTAHGPSHPPTADPGWQVLESSTLSQGTSLELIGLSSPPQRIAVITVAPHARLRPVLVKAGPDPAPYAPVSVAVQRTGALAGTTGYFVKPPAETPMLVVDGRIVASPRGGFSGERHPRTGIGVTAEGAALFVTVDGRQAGAVGMTLREFASITRSLGAVWAVNLDGGASTTMVVHGEVRNSPSDPHGERAVLTALVLIPSGCPARGHMPRLVRQLRRLDHRIVLPLVRRWAVREGPVWLQRA